MTTNMQITEVIAIFYLRPGNLFKDFLVAKSGGGVDSKGRAAKSYDTDNAP